MKNLQDTLSKFIQTNFVKESVENIEKFNVFFNAFK